MKKQWHWTWLELLSLQSLFPLTCWFHDNTYSNKVILPIIAIPMNLWRSFSFKPSQRQSFFIDHARVKLLWCTLESGLWIRWLWPSIRKMCYKQCSVVCWITVSLFSVCFSYDWQKIFKKLIAHHFWLPLWGWDIRSSLHCSGCHLIILESVIQGTNTFPKLSFAICISLFGKYYTAI